MLHCLACSMVPGSAAWIVDGINQVKTWSNTSNEHNRVQVGLSLTQRFLSAPPAKEGMGLNISIHPLLGSREAPPDVALPKLMTICRVLRPPLCQRSPTFVSSLPQKHCHKLQGYLPVQGMFMDTCFPTRMQATGNQINFCWPPCGPQTWRGSVFLQTCKVLAGSPPSLLLDVRSGIFMCP